MSSFTRTIVVDQTPAEVFAAVTNPRAWWSEGIVGRTEHVDDEFVYQVPDIHRSQMKLTEVVPNQRVVWHVLDNHLSFVQDQTEWVDTDITFEITHRGGTTALTFTHDGLVPQFECWDACSDGWSFYVRSLHDLITTGTGQPNALPAELEALERAGATR